MEGLGRFEEQERRRNLDDLYRDHAGWLRARLCRWIGHSAADDVVQDTYARIALSADADEVRSPRALLLSVARNLVRDDLRRQGVRRRSLETVRGVGGDAAKPDAVEMILLKQAILTLPAECRDVFVMSRFEGMSHTEIAAACGISRRAVEYRLQQAMLHCAAILGD